MAAARRMATTIGAESLAMALDYQLMGNQTNCILVHQRTDADKATGEAEIHRVGSMLAAGWGASSTVNARMLRRPHSICEDSLASPAVWRSARSQAAATVDTLGNDGMDQIELHAYMAANDLDPALTSFRALAMAVVDHLQRSGWIEGLASHCASLPLHPDVRQALAHERGMITDPGVALLALAHWVTIRGIAIDVQAAVPTLQPHLSGVDAALLAQWMALFDSLLGDCVDASGPASRRQRLGRAMSRAET